MADSLDSFLAADGVAEDKISTQPKVSVEQQVFNQVANDQRDSEKVDLQQSMFVAKEKNPDKQAQVLSLSKKMSLPSIFVEKNFDTLSKKVQTDLDYDGMVDKNPRLSKWLSNIDNSAIAKDDLPALRDIEDTTHEYTGLASAYHALNYGLLNVLSGVAKTPEYLWDTSAALTNAALDKVDSSLPRVGKVSEIAPENWGKDIANRIDEISNQEKAKLSELNVDVLREFGNDPKKAGKALFIQAVASAPTSLAALVAHYFGFGTASLVGIGVTSAATKYDQNLKKQQELKDLKQAKIHTAMGEVPVPSVEGGTATADLMNPNAPDQKQGQISDNMALLDATLYGTIEGGVEGISFGVLAPLEKSLIKQFGKAPAKEILAAFGKTMAASVLSEGGEEVVTQAGQSIVSYATGVDRNALRDLPNQMANAGIVGGASGGLFSGPSTGLHALGKYHETVQTNLVRDYYDKMLEKAQATKLGKRSADAQNELVKEITKGGPETVYVPVKEYETYLQKKNISPAQFSEDLGVSEKYQEAKETGGDVAIPYATWLGKLSDTEHYAGLKDDIKFDPGMTTYNQQREEAEAIKATEKAASDQAAAEAKAEETQTAFDAAKPIGENISEQLQKTGRVSTQEAKDNAAALEGFFRTLGEREGLDPVQLFEKYGVKIEASDVPVEGDLNQKVEGVERINGTQLKQHLLDTLHPDETDQVDFQGEMADELISKFDEWELHTVPVEKIAGYPKDIAAWNEVQNKVKEYLNLNSDAPAIVAIPVNSKKYHSSVVRGKKGQTLYAPDGKHRLLAAKESGQKTIDVWLPVDKKTNKVVLYQGDQNPLGQIAMRDGETIIRLFSGKDKSTFLHESGHLYMKVLSDLVMRPEASDQLKKDYQSILDYLGVKSFEEIKTEQQEKFAETVEAYFLKGTAPSTSLKRVFNRFKTWLTSIYGSIKNNYFERYGVQITPEIKDVMDRMFATDAEIKKAKSEMGLSPLPSASLGMTPDQEARYMSAIDEANRDSDERLLAQLMRDSDVKRSPEYKDKRKEVVTQITNDVNSMPAYKAIDLIQNSNLENGGVDLKINRAEVKEVFGEGAYKNMPRGTTSEEGMPVAMVAEQLGFPNAKSLVDAITTAEDKDALIERRAEAQMSELYPDLMDNGELAQAAIDAIHNDKTSEVLKMEWEHVLENNPGVLKDLIRRGTRINFNDPARRQQAKAIMQQKKVGEIRPIDYQRAGAKAARESGELLTKGDFAGFIEAKRQQLLNHELYKAALEAKALVKKGNDLFKKIYRTDTKDAAKSRDADYLNAQKAILAQYGVGPEQPMLPNDYLEKIANYDPVTFAALKPIIDSATVGAAGWQTISLARYSQLVDDMIAIRDIGRDARQFQLAKEKIEFDNVKAETIAQNDEHKKHPTKYDHERSRWDEFKIKMLGWKNSLRRVEAYTKMMDLGKRGPWTKYFWEPVNEAFTNYMLDRNTYYQKFVNLSKSWSTSLTKQDWQPIEAKELGVKADGSVTQFKNKLDLIAAIKHTGNASNIEKMIGGFNWGQIDENGQVDLTNWNKFMSRMYQEGRITQADMDYVQATWDIYEELKPRAQAAHKKDTGYYFQEIKPQEIVTPFGKYKGGYVPLVYDRTSNPNVARNAFKSEILDNNPGYEMPGVSKGFTKERVKFFSPLSLDLQQTNRDLDALLKFINLRAPVKQAARLLYNKEFSASIHAVDPTAIENLLEPFLARAATNKVIFTDGKTKKWLNDFAGFLKSSATANTMIWNFGNALQNYASLFPAQVLVDPNSLSKSLKHTRSAMVQYLTAPNDSAKFIAEKSKFMRTEIEEGAAEAQRDLKKIALNPTRIQKAGEFLEANSFALMKMTQRQTSNIVWLAAYNSELSKGVEVEDAVRHADRTVRSTQGDQRAIGVSEIETGSPWYRNFAMYTGFFNVIGNLINTESNIALQTLTPAQATKRLATIYTMGFMMLAIGGDLIIKGLRGDLDEDGDGEYLDDFLYTFFDSQFRFGTAMIPLIGPGINYSRKFFDRNINEVFGLQNRPVYQDDKLSLSPALSTLESAGKGIHSSYKLLTDPHEMKRRDVKDGLTLLGLAASAATGKTIPLGGFQKPVGYSLDVSSGDASPENPVDFARGLVTGKQSK